AHARPAARGGVRHPLLGALSEWALGATGSARTRAMKYALTALFLVVGCTPTVILGTLTVDAHDDLGALCTECDFAADDVDLGGLCTDCDLGVEDDLSNFGGRPDGPLSDFSDGFLPSDANSDL